MAHRDLDVLDAAQRAVDGVNKLIARRSQRLLHVTQLRAAAQSVVANISEGFGRGPGRDRAKSLRIARAECEEAIQHLFTNRRANLITAREYWPLHNLFVVIVKMLNSLLSR